MVGPEQRDASGGVRRVLSGAAGLGLGLLTLGMVLITIFACSVASEVPDAFDVQGEMSSNPGTWGESFELVAIATGIAAFTGVMAAGTLALLFYASMGRAVRRRAAVLVVLVPTALAWLAICGTLYANRSDAHLAVDCDGFQFDRVAFASPDPDDWDHEARGLASCQTLQEKTAAQVIEMLGPAKPLKTDKQTLSYHDQGFVVIFSRGRVFDVSYSPDRTLAG